MPEVVLIRAGATDFDDEQRIQGSIELPLNERGHAEVEEVIQDLVDDGIAIIITAPSEPSKSTASGISKGLGGVKVKENKGLANLNQGLWEGLQAEAIRRKYPRLFRQWKESPGSVCPPEGETLQELQERVRKVLEKPLKKKDTVAIVAAEPLATILGCILQGRCPELSDCLCGEDDTQQVTRIRIDADEVREILDRPISESNGGEQVDGQSKGKS